MVFLLQHRSQRVRIATNQSSYSQLNGAMPQGSWLGPLSFLVLINNFKPDWLVNKYVDDTTLTELLYDRTKPSGMQSFFHQLLNWANQNDMVVNLTKTKEMVFGPPSITSNLPPISASSYQIQRGIKAKLLGEHIDSNLSWHTHVEAIVSNATQRLYFLKQLKRAGVPRVQLLHFYISVIRPVLEYAVPVWHHLLIKTQTDSIESVRKRALRIIYSFSNDISYCNSLDVADIANLSSRRSELHRIFFIP